MWVERDARLPLDMKTMLGLEMDEAQALRAGDLAYLHTHPAGGDGHGDAIRFETEFPTEARYRLFLQFKHGGEVHTAAFTREVAR